mmetsp:Transcript_21103/g.35943  ORF Transcript_21103/g.35943 Transcript_21103/m.35943 type:complete len:116 (-) Transcript_21103:477-824(-)
MSLPPEWKQHFDSKSGRYYYYNSETKKSVWNRPAAPLQSFSSPRTSTPLFRLLNPELFWRPHWSFGVAGTAIAVGVFSWMIFGRTVGTDESQQRAVEEKRRESRKERARQNSDKL